VKKPIIFLSYVFAGANGMTEKRKNPFKLKDFRGVDNDQVIKLAQAGIKTTEQMLAAASTPWQRAALAKKSGVPQEAILELVKLSDLARLPGVKGIRARLYYEAGVDSVEKLAAWEPEALRLKMTAYVEQSGFDGTPPLPKEVSSTIENAQKLPIIVENG
jgi:hypothetical protein